MKHVPKNELVQEWRLPQLMVILMRHSDDQFGFHKMISINFIGHQKLNSDFWQKFYVALGVFHLTLYSPTMGLFKHGYQAAAARRAGEEAERPFCGLSLEKF